MENRALKSALSRNVSAFGIEAALAECGGNKSRAAQRLGLTLRQFSYRLAKLKAG